MAGSSCRIVTPQSMFEHVSNVDSGVAWPFGVGPMHTSRSDGSAAAISRAAADFSASNTSAFGSRRWNSLI